MMRSFFSRSFSIVFGLSLLGAGCARSAAVTSSTPVPVVPTIPSAFTACDHPYYPLHAGYLVRYEIQSRNLQGAPQTHHYSQRVEHETPDSVDLVTNFEDLGDDRAGQITSNQTIHCENGTLRANAYVDLGSHLTGGAMSKFRVDTKHVTGELLPPNLQVGSEWDGSFDISLVPTVTSTGLLKDGMHMNIRTHRKVVSEEDVTVPAGTYKALKVSAATEVGSGGKPTASLQTTEWWVKDIGLVKSIYPVGGAMGDIVTVAQEVNVR